MKKVRTTINLNEDVVRKAKYFKINISSIAERAIIDYIKELENIGREPSGHYVNSDTYSNSESNLRSPTKNNKMGLLRFELRSIAPEATRIPSYPTSP